MTQTPFKSSVTGVEADDLIRPLDDDANGDPAAARAPNGVVSDIRFGEQRCNGRFKRLHADRERRLGAQGVRMVDDASF